MSSLLVFYIKIRHGTSHQRSLHQKLPLGNALQFDADRLDLGIVLKHLVALLAAPAGLLVATKGQGGVEDVVAIDPHGSSVEFCRELVRLAEVLRPDASSQAKHTVVGKGKNFIQFLKW